MNNTYTVAMTKQALSYPNLAVAALLTSGIAGGLGALSGSVLGKPSFSASVGAGGALGSLALGATPGLLLSLALKGKKPGLAGKLFVDLTTVPGYILGLPSGMMAGAIAHTAIDSLTEKEASVLTKRALAPSTKLLSVLAAAGLGAGAGAVPGYMVGHADTGAVLGAGAAAGSLAGLFLPGMIGKGLRQRERGLTGKLLSLATAPIVLPLQTLRGLVGGTAGAYGLKKLLEEQQSLN